MTPRRKRLWSCRLQCACCVLTKMATMTLLLRWSSTACTMKGAKFLNASFFSENKIRIHLIKETSKPCRVLPHIFKVLIEEVLAKPNFVVMYAALLERCFALCLDCTGFAFRRILLFGRLITFHIKQLFTIKTALACYSAPKMTSDMIP